MFRIFFLFLHPSWYLHKDLFELYLDLPYGKQKFVDSGEDLHEIWSKNEVDRPAHIEVQRKIAPDIAIVTRWSRYHLPLVYFCLTIEVANVGDEANVGSVHLESEIVGKFN